MTIDIQAALEVLQNGEEPQRRRTVEELSAARAAGAVLPLLLAVGDESWPVRQAAAEALVSFPAPLLFPALETALREQENASLRNAAMEIFVKMGPAAVAPLLALLRDADE